MKRDGHTLRMTLVFGADLHVKMGASCEDWENACEARVQKSWIKQAGCALLT